MKTQNSVALDPQIFAVVLDQNWQNVRNIKTERLWFMNTYTAITAGALTLLQTIRGEVVRQIALLGFMCAFSLMGLLTSLRLKAELDESLDVIQAIVAHGQMTEFMALGRSAGVLSRYPPFRWMLPAFYALTVAGFATLVAYRIMVPEPPR